jgi:glycosyltransferase involved in cell wall biosynthesis
MPGALWPGSDLMPTFGNELFAHSSGGGHDVIYFDITELATNPIRTGIQRVTREALRHWSSKQALRPCFFDKAIGNLRELPQAALDPLLETDDAARRAPVADIRIAVADIMAQSSIDVIPQTSPVVIPEVFFDEMRCRHHLWRMEGGTPVFMLFHDFIPWLYPEAIGVERCAHLMWYLRLAQKCAWPAFNSETTRAVWQERVIRDASRSGPVLPLGGDGLPVAKQAFSPQRRTFIALGSIDGRKNQMRILDAFELLWNRGIDASLTFIGRVFDSETSTLDRLSEAKRSGKFRHLQDIDDEMLAEQFKTARATLYMSELEGFGLPPIESLFAGIPVVTTRNVPSISALAESGVVMLDDVRPESIAAAVELMLDDGRATELWAQADRTEIPTWRSFGEAVTAWVDNGLGYEARIT